MLTILLLVLAVTVSHFVQVEAPKPRKYRCEPIDDKWGRKEYEMQESEFCAPFWDQPRGHPDCDDQIAPTVTFYAQDNMERELCSIDMNDHYGSSGILKDCTDKIIDISTNNENACPTATDWDLCDLTSKSKMEASGWQFYDINYDMPSHFLSACGDKTWYGFKYPGIGQISATFEGMGIATLGYGNCHTAGQTNVFLNERLIDSAGRNTPSKQIVFDFTPGDVLLINEFDEGIIKLNSLTVECKRQCNGVPSTGWSCCSSASPCIVGGGDCDTDSECMGSLVCGSDNCQRDYSSTGSNWSGTADCCIGIAANCQSFADRPLHTRCSGEEVHFGGGYAWEECEQKCTEYASQHGPGCCEGRSSTWGKCGYYAGESEIAGYYDSKSIQCFIHSSNVFGCNKIALKSYHGQYIVAESDGTASANRQHARSGETFTVEELGGNKIALKSTHGKYLVAEQANYEVNANSAGRASWEIFTVEKQAGGTIALKTAHGRYVVAESDGRLRADRTKVGDWEKFRPECKEIWLVYIVHGFTEQPDHFSKWYGRMREAVFKRYTKHGRRLIVAQVDWHYGARSVKEDLGVALEWAKGKGEDALEFAKKTGEDVLELAKGKGEDALEFGKETGEDVLEFGMFWTRSANTTDLEADKNNQVYVHDRSVFGTEQDFFDLIDAFRLVNSLTVRPMSCSMVFLAGYLRAASNTMVIGQLLGSLTKLIVAKVPKVKSVCIGHSLGAQVCGFTGKTEGLDMDAIIGLDPAGPIFEHNTENNRLSKTDAKKVYALHTDISLLGIKYPVGDIDYYVNGGQSQPKPEGCKGGVEWSHESAKLFLMDLMSKGDTGPEQQRCNHWMPAELGRCYKRDNRVTPKEEVANLEDTLGYIETVADDIRRFDINPECTEDKS